MNDKIKEISQIMEDGDPLGTVSRYLPALLRIAEFARELAAENPCYSATCGPSECIVCDLKGAFAALEHADEEEVTPLPISLTLHRSDGSDQSFMDEIIRDDLDTPFAQLAKEYATGIFEELYFATTVAMTIKELVGGQSIRIAREDLCDPNER